MTATVNGKGTNVAVMDATDLTVAANAVSPSPRLTAGEGAPGHLRIVEDVIALDAAGLADTGSYYRFCRVPASAKIKRVSVFSDGVLDSNATSTLKLRFGVGWSDANDGTPKAYQGLNPAAAKDGTNAVATTSNALFGDIDKSTTDNTAIPMTEITHAGTVATLLALVQKSLVNVFGFVTGTGNAQSDSGYMDITVHVQTAAATAVAGNLYGRVEYVV